MKKIFTLFLLALAMNIANSQTVIQKVVVEEFTGAWCGYCPDGALILENILATKPNAIGVSIHNSDGMVTSDGNSVDAFYNALGYPAAIINRQDEAIARNLWSSATTTALNATPSVAVSIDSVDYDEITRTVTATVRAEFVANETGTFRLNFMLVEDEVTGTGATFNQTNYYNTTAGHPCYGLGNPIVGWVHHTVLRSCGSGGWGANGVIATNPTAGSVYTKKYTKVLSGTWDEDEMNMVAWVAHYDGSGMTQRAIENAEELHLSAFIASNDNAQLTDVGMQVYPNPTSEHTSVVYDLEKSGTISLDVYNTLGQKMVNLSQGFTTAGNHTVGFDLKDASGTNLANGVYIVKLTSDNGQTGVQRLVVNQ